MSKTPREVLTEAYSAENTFQPVDDNRHRHQLSSRVEAAGVHGPAGDAMRVIKARLSDGSVTWEQLAAEQRLQLGLYEEAVKAQAKLAASPDEFGRRQA